MKENLIISAVMLNFLAVMNNSVQADVLLDFNEPAASGINWLGWTWYDGGASGADGWGSSGWRDNSGRYYSGNSNWLPRIHEKNDYGNSAKALIDAEDRAPSTSSGGSLKVYDDGTSSTKQAGWFYLWGENFGAVNKADPNTDRLSFYLKTQGMPSRTYSGWIDDYNMHFGTYLCWSSCPKEDGNNHYYHHLTVNSDAWLHVQLERNPQHQRGQGGNSPPGNNPSGSRNYFQYMNQFYLEIRYPQPNLTAYWVDEISLWQASQPENDVSISSLWVGYWPNSGKWEIGFNDNSFSGNYGNNTQSTFEIRYSINPITNNNFSQAATINPEFNNNGVSRIKRPNPWQMPTWTRFALPSSIVQNNDKIYFAIKDVSKTSSGDGHNAPNSNIRTIDYNLTTGSSASTIEPPVITSVQ